MTLMWIAFAVSSILLAGIAGVMGDETPSLIFSVIGIVCAAAASIIHEIRKARR